MGKTAHSWQPIGKAWETMDDRPAMAGLGRWKKKQFVAVSSQEKQERRQAGSEDRELNTQN